QPAADNEPTVLEDFMLQAEIFLQYSMRSKAVERLERIQKLFPREEEKNEKLRSLYMSAGITPKYAGAPPAPAAAKPAAPVATKAPVTPPAGTPVVAAQIPTNTSAGTAVTRAVANETVGDTIAQSCHANRDIA